MIAQGQFTYLFLILLIAGGCGRGAGYTPEYAGGGGGQGANVADSENSTGGSIDSEDGSSIGDSGAGNDDQTPSTADNGLGSLEEEARGNDGEESGNFKCKYMRSDGETSIAGAFPVQVPYPFQESFDGQWSDDDSEYTFTMVVGKFIDFKRIPDICYDDPENGQCGGKQAYQVKTKGRSIGDRYSLHHFDVTVHNADSEDCDVSAKNVTD